VSIYSNLHKAGLHVKASRAFVGVNELTEGVLVFVRVKLSSSVRVRLLLCEKLRDVDVIYSVRNLLEIDSSGVCIRRI
jgi:hypothetical protein